MKSEPVCEMSISMVVATFRCDFRQFHRVVRQGGLLLARLLCNPPDTGSTPIWLYLFSSSSLITSSTSLLFLSSFFLKPLSPQTLGPPPGSMAEALQ